MSYVLELKDVAFSYGGTDVLRGLSLTVSKGEILGLCGESGCGKTTTLRIAAGLEQPQRGHVFINGLNVTHTDPRRWGVGAIFQEPALYPWYRVRGNIALRLALKGVTRSTRTASVEQIADDFGISDLLDRRMDELSGGQRQRVALAGEMIDESVRLLLLDEPFNSLDPDTRAWFDGWTRVQIQRSGKAAIFVTHDVTEAQRVCDRIAYMKRGSTENIELVERKRSPELN